MENPQAQAPSQIHANKTTDPFGRMLPDDGSQSRFHNMADITVLEAAVGPTDDNHPDDVARMEIMLGRVGLMNLRETDGPTGYYGERLRQAISALQRQLGMPETGRIAPNDPTHTALQQKIAEPRKATQQGIQPSPEAVTSPQSPTDMR